MKSDGAVIAWSRGIRFPALYSILIGSMMIGQWSLSIDSRAVPEFETAPLAIAFHLAAEIATALLLIVGGIATLRSKVWGARALMVGLGMVMYSEIVSPGYFAQKHQWPFVLMFVLLLAGAIASAAFLFREQSNLNRS